MSEAKETKRVLEWLNAFDGVFAFKVHADMYQMSGASDILCCWLGLYVAIEMKDPDKPNETGRPKQEHFQRTVRQAEGVAFVAHSLAEVRQCLIRHQLLGLSSDRPRRPKYPG